MHSQNSQTVHLKNNTKPKKTKKTKAIHSTPQ